MLKTQAQTFEFPPVLGDQSSLYLNRERSWIQFNARVLAEATDERNPLLERVKFLAIFASNLDEFFMIRVSGVKQQIAAQVQKRSPDGLTPIEQIAAIRRVLLPQLKRARALFLEELVPKLADQGICLYNFAQLNEQQRKVLSAYYDQEVFPVLTPLAVDPSHPFPLISNLSLNLAVFVRDSEGEELFARVKIPEVLPRLVPLPECTEHPKAVCEAKNCFVWLEQVIMAYLPTLFPGMEVIEAYPFRVIRNADMEIEEDEADDLLQTIEQGVRQRRFGAVVQIEVDKAMPKPIRQLLLSKLKISSEDLYTVKGPLGLADLIALMKLNRPDLKDPPIYPNIPYLLRGHLSIFEAIRQQDILLHHPYDSFQPIIDFIQTAADDPDVLAIKQTLYRVGSNSPIVAALMRAREQGKQVTVLVELKARFDEENNIIWARALESTGVHVVYGLLGLKTHAKLALVVRKEQSGILRYVHLGTGNYNATTARIYTDLGLLTCRPDIGADVSEVFNFLTGYSRQRDYRKLLVAPIMLRERLIRLIEREMTGQQECGQGGRLIFKMNSLVDPQMILALYRASQAGVQIDLIIRGMCCLRPGIPGLSENIHVRSVIGPFLEHSRVYYFANGGQEEIYMGSADLMQRNLDQRVEAIFPLEDPTLRSLVLEGLLETQLRDNLRAWVLQPDGEYLRQTPKADEVVVDSQSSATMYCHSGEKIEYLGLKREEMILSRNA